MVDNLPLRTVQHGGLTIEGYSRAAVQTYWRIPELKLGFDLGGSPWSFTGTDKFFITHTHLDHMAALPVYVARRRMMKMEPPTIYLPAHALEATRRMLRAWHRLDRGRMACELVGVEPGQEIELSRERVVTVFPTRHTVPSVGYVVWSRRKKLKPELQGLSQDEIRDRRLAGEEVTYELREPLLCFTGDTSPAGWDACEAVYTAMILITELTFFRPDHRRSKIHKFGHTHLDDLLERADRFANELIILTHFSTRYSDQHIQKALMKRMPENLRQRVHLWF
ncbi:MAG: metal-dependent hydrolase [Planctomycetota bacterium]|nr:MAG: metal-dependent hydrolase [Planctomycetota bacterium]